MALTNAQRARITNVIDKSLREFGDLASWPLKHLVTTVKTDVDGYQAVVNLHAADWRVATNGGVTVKRRWLDVVACRLKTVRHELTLDAGQASKLSTESDENIDPEGTIAKLRKLAATARRAQLVDTVDLLLAARATNEAFQPVTTMTSVVDLLGALSPGRQTLVAFQPVDRSTKEALKETTVELVEHAVDPPIVITHGRRQLRLLGLLISGPKPFLVRYQAYDLGASAAEHPTESDDILVAVEERRGLRMRDSTYFVLFGSAS